MRILMYHAILPASETDPAIARRQVHVGAFERHLRWLRRYARVLSLADAVGLLTAGERPPRGATVLTFDDGLWNHAELAFPLLERYELPATFFVPTDHLDGNRILWFNRLAVEAIMRTAPGGSSLEELRRLRAEVEAEPSGEPASRVAKLLGLDIPPVANTDRFRDAVGGMTSEQLRRVAASALVEIGGHTATHPRLPLCSPEQQHEEIAGSRTTLENITGKRVRFFAYPEGGFSQAVVDAVRTAGFEAAVAVETNDDESTDVYRLPRIVVNRDGTVPLAAKWSGLVGPVRRLRRTLGLRVPQARQY